MQTYVNQKHIDSRTKLGRRSSMIGLMVLALGMVASFAPPTIQRWALENPPRPIALNPFVQWIANGGWLFVSMLALVAGYTLGQMGNRLARRFMRTVRPDQIVEKGLKGFDDRNRLYAWSAPVDLALAGPAGIFAIITRDTVGKVSIVGDKINQPFSWRRVLLSFSQAGPGQPVAEAAEAADKLSKWLTQQTSAAEAVPVTPLIVFTDDNVQLDAEGASVAAVHHKQLKQYLRNQAGAARMSRATLTAAIDKLDAEAKRRGAELIE